MGSLLNRLSQIVRHAISKTPAEISSRMDRPSGQEPGIKHPVTGAHVFLTDDGGVDISSSTGTSILAQNNSIGIKASGVSVEASHFHMHGQIWYGYQRLDPLLLWYSPPGDPTWLFRCSPLVANLPTSLSTVLLTGDPTKPVPIPLSALVHSQPLFGPNEAYLILAESLSDIATELVEVTTF